MLKRILFVITLLMLVVPTLAQSDQWLIWLYRPFEKKFVQMDSDGTLIREVVLKHEFPEYTALSFNAAVSDDGTALAYGEQGVSGELDAPAQIVILNPDTNEPYAIYPLNPQLEGVSGVTQEGFNNAATSLTFNEKHDSLAFGYSFHTNPDDPNIYGWEIVAVNFTEQDPYPSLTWQETASVLDTPTDAAYIILIHRYERDTIIFTLVPVFIRQATKIVTAAWNVKTDAVRKVELSFAGNGDFQEEMILTPIRESADPNSDLAGDAPDARTLELYNMISRQTQTIYTIDEGSILAAKFIQDNERIAALVYVPVLESSVLRILDLDGSIVGQIDEGTPGFWYSTPDGLLYKDYNEALIHVNTRGDELVSTMLMEDTGGVSGIYIQTHSN